MKQRLQELEKGGTKIRIALVGAGAMGLGIAWQIGRTPGMELVAVVDLNLEAAKKAALAARRSFEVLTTDGVVKYSGAVLVSETPFSILAAQEDLKIDVLVEATNTIGFAAKVCLAAIDNGSHVILMNAEVDLALGPLLFDRARKKGVVMTSDAGDQPGVLMTMINEIEFWDFRIVMAGNIKGFLDLYATAKSLEHEAKIRNLNPVQCCAYTDGTKLNIEMALISNGTGLLPHVRGMEGPRAKQVTEVLGLFDFSRYDPERGVVDYILGAEPGGGVYVVGYCDDPIQMPYLKYYKLGDGPYYLFYRPYHLCHLETTTAIAAAYFDRRAILQPTLGRRADVYAFAKRDLQPGDIVHHSIGGDLFYGLIDSCPKPDAERMVPIAILEEEGEKKARMKRALKKDEALHFDDIEMPDTYLHRMFTKQQAMV